MAKINDKQIARLQRLLSLLDPDTLTKEEFVKSFEKVVDLVLKIRKEQEEKMVRIEKILNSKLDNKISSAISDLEGLKKTYKEIIEKVEKENKSTFSNIRRWTIERVNALFIKSKIDNKIKEIDNKIASIKPVKGDKGDKGDPAKEVSNERIQELMSPAIEDFRKHWEGEVQRVMRSRGRGVGGASVINPRPMKGLSTDSIPAITGSINGTNKDFVLPKAPIKDRGGNYAVALFLNGVRQREGSSNDFTIAGKTITFADAPQTNDIIICDIDY